MKLKTELVASGAGILFIDPLRYALNKPKVSGTTDEMVAVEALDQVSKLQQRRPSLATILIHHLKKRQDPRFKVRLQKDPTTGLTKSTGHRLYSATLIQFRDLRRMAMGTFLPRLIRLIAEKNEGTRTIHFQSSRQHSAFESPKGSRSTDSQGKGRERAG